MLHKRCNFVIAVKLNIPFKCNLGQSYLCDTSVLKDCIVFPGIVQWKHKIFMIVPENVLFTVELPNWEIDKSNCNFVIDIEGNSNCT